MALRMVLALCLASSLQGVAVDASERVQLPEDTPPNAPPPVMHSNTYAVSQATAAAGATRMTSTNFATTATAAQLSPAGGASFCNAGSRTTVGFWSILGLGPVPILLAGRRNLADPLDVDLQWSGVASTYQLYRSFRPEDILNPANLDRETASCSATDEFAFQSNLIFYSVIPTP